MDNLVRSGETPGQGIVENLPPGLLGVRAAAGANRTRPLGWGFVRAVGEHSDVITAM
ncbi:hypothetical protein [Propionibacterium australiense]|uniref:hypothetical protein n=1 Tax=Propionibacterium australiense TaxID=119981 RepID=UPI001476F1E6|nr:hypothetical protein [Propionibacterium australiense]